MPSGHVPAAAFANPELQQKNTINCLIQVPEDLQENARRELENQVGVRKELLDCWYSDNFGEAAKTVYALLNSPEITVESAWDVFAQMSSQF